MTVNETLAFASFGFVVLMAAAGALIWFVRLEGRVNTQAALHVQFKEQVDKEHSSLAKRFDDGLKDVKGSIDRVFDLLDRKADK